MVEGLRRPGEFHVAVARAGGCHGFGDLADEGVAMHRRTLRRRRELQAELRLHLAGGQGLGQARDRRRRPHRPEHAGHLVGRPRPAGGQGLRWRRPRALAGRPGQGVERRPQRVPPRGGLADFLTDDPRGRESAPLVVHRWLVSELDGAFSGGRRRRLRSPRRRPRLQRRRDAAGGGARLHTARGLLRHLPPRVGADEEAGGDPAVDVHGVPGVEGREFIAVQQACGRGRLLPGLRARWQGGSQDEHPMPLL
mmetsp:Transcript_127331/g.368681  ORF Transcript_127331/g.368681 Transcript_127331/m.368681 type:complete len:252 (+) Transcript_127331:791-1546(+)